MNGTRTATVSGGRWNWASIRAVNIFFENYEKVNESPANIAQYAGEAHFFKAWFYFDKVRYFGDVPWYTNSMQVDDTQLYNARTPRTQVMDSVLWHLDQAIAKLNYLKDNNAVGGNNRLSKEAALILATNGISTTRELVWNYLKKDGTPYDYDALATTVKGLAYLAQIGTSKPLW